jgi:hypothetical protein
LKQYRISKQDALERFAKSVPNANKMLVDWGRNLILIQNGSPNGLSFQITEILDKAKALGLKKEIGRASCRERV